jgi:hypothetical protein
LFLTISAYNLNAFRFLWVDQGYNWNHVHWKNCLDLIEKLERFTLLKELFGSKTSTEIFESIDFNLKYELMAFFLSPDRKYKDKYIEYLKKEPFRYTYVVYTGANNEELDEDEMEEIRHISEDIHAREVVASKDEKIDHLKTFLKSVKKYQEDDAEEFDTFRPLAAKTVNLEKYSKFKAEDSEGEKVLTEISENENEKEEEKDASDVESVDSDDFPEDQEYIEYARKGDIEKLRNAAKHKDFIDVLEMVGLNEEVEVGDDTVSTDNWNALLFAIYYNKMDVVKYYANESSINFRLAMADPEERESEEKEFENQNGEFELFGIKLAIHKRNKEMLDFLWNTNNRVWGLEHFEAVADLINNISWMEGLKVFLRSKTSMNMFIDLPFKAKEKFFNEGGFLHKEDDSEEENSEDEEEDKQDREELFEILSEAPYSLGMVLCNRAKLRKYREIAKGNIKDN